MLYSGGFDTLSANQLTALGRNDWWGRETGNINHCSECILKALHALVCFTEQRASEVVHGGMLKGGRSQLQWVSWEGKALGQKKSPLNAPQLLLFPLHTRSASSSWGPFSGPVNQMKDRPFSFVPILTGKIRSPKGGLFQACFGNYVWIFHT